MSRSHCSRKRTSLEIRSARPCVHARIRGTRTRINSLPVRAGRYGVNDRFVFCSRHPSTTLLLGVCNVHGHGVEKLREYSTHEPSLATGSIFNRYLRYR